MWQQNWSVWFWTTWQLWCRNSRGVYVTVPGRVGSPCCPLESLHARKETSLKVGKVYVDCLVVAEKWCSISNIGVTWWHCGRTIERLWVRLPARCRCIVTSSGEVVHTCLPLLLRSIIWYRCNSREGYDRLWKRCCLLSITLKLKFLPTAGSRPWNGDEHCTWWSHGCERALLTRSNFISNVKNNCVGKILELYLLNLWTVLLRWYYDVIYSDVMHLGTCLTCAFHCSH